MLDSEEFQSLSESDPSGSVSNGSKGTKSPLSALLFGIDSDIKRIFLTLPPRKLSKVFIRYGEIYGISKLIYAKNTYAGWQVGAVTMSGVVLARLLNLVPLVIEPSDRFDLVKKLRDAYLCKQHIEVSCDPTNWFKRVPPV